MQPGPSRGSSHLSHAVTGFTLVELVMVIMIIGILSVSFAPRIASLSTYDTRTWTDDLREVLRHARSLAAYRGCGVRADVSADGYALWHDARCHQEATPDFSLPVLSALERTPIARPLPESLTVEPVSLIFQPDGTVTFPAAPAQTFVQITLDTQQVQVWLASGRVQ